MRERDAGAARRAQPRPDAPLPTRAAARWFDLRAALDLVHCARPGITDEQRRCGPMELALELATERAGSVTRSTAIRSPSWTTSPSLTAIWATVPSDSASTGISIFIDSRITSVSPSATRRRRPDDLPHVGHHLGADLLGHRGPLLVSCRPGRHPIMRSAPWSDRSTDCDGRRIGEVTIRAGVAMAKKSRKKKARKKSAANHGKRPNAPVDRSGKASARTAGLVARRAGTRASRPRRPARRS